RAAPYKDPSQPVAVRVEDLLSRMTLEEKIGQMTQVESNSISPYYLFPPSEIVKYFIGSVLSGGNSSGYYSLADWNGLAKSFEVEAVKTRLGIPLIFGVDSVHGFGHVNGATIFPQNIGLGATRDPELVRQIGDVTAEEMRAAGIPWNFAPCVAVPQDIRWGRTYEGFSEDTALVTELSAAYIQGFQTVPEGYAASEGQSLYALATPKHYIGDGGTAWGSIPQYMYHQYMLDTGDTRVDEATLRRLFLPPYQAAVNSGAMSVMVSFSSWNGVKMHAQRYLLTDVLKGELGFQGFVVSDWGGINRVDPDYYKAVVTAINAGIDMNMVPTYYQMFIAIMKQAVMNGDIPQERIDDAVRRILRAKFMLGLFENPYGDPSLAVTVGSDEHRALARQAVRESLVLLKNDNNALPIDKNVSTILVAGINSTGIQAGGWTLEWQGEQRNTLAGTTILEGIQELVGPNTQVLYNSLGQFASFSSKAPVGIAIVGEVPYAEGLGDRADLTLYKVDLNVINALRPKVDKLIVVILSGRPLVITDQYQTADAWVAAWLPGSEGAGVTDVLFGDYPFVGKLPYTWPRSNDQLPLNTNNSANLTGCAAPLFPFGYGLGSAGSQPIEWLNCP
ncbi:MAG TPA: glycoside hydrolase family 3 N-terminal domain-containing protein, partial [Anaerolineales bacterium]